MKKLLTITAIIILVSSCTDERLTGKVNDLEQKVTRLIDLESTKAELDSIQTQLILEIKDGKE